ncbi:hypothetical protein [Pasteuria penetrans]|uniref:hypothetical protein n=1 Tax=Pasteuria penetrans TaxID=86005 RepID=UPI0011F04538|nr:hypothetical protein [Pasteuria penetrans]
MPIQNPSLVSRSSYLPLLCSIQVSIRCYIMRGGPTSGSFHLCASDAAKTVGGSALHGFVPRTSSDTLVSTSTEPFDAFLPWFDLLISLIHTGRDSFVLPFPRTLTTIALYNKRRVDPAFQPSPSQNWT